MNKFIVIALLSITFTSHVFSNVIFEKKGLSNNSLSINDVLSDDVKNSLNDEQVYVSNTLYQIKNGLDIEVEYIVSDKKTEIVNYDSEILINSGYGSKDSIFPYDNLIVSDPMVFRGVLVRQITFIPFTYNMMTKELTTFENVEFNISEVSSNVNIDYNDVKLSRSFESLYESSIINYERSNRDEDYQSPSILYICGGSSLNNPFVQDLLEWRHKRGYIVNAVSTNEIGGSSTVAVKGYIQEAYDTWENPPEIVGLIGDTGGSYSIGYYTEGWSGYNGAGDFPYCQLDGSDLLPEVFIGRISVNSSSDLSNVLNKTLAYEKATYINQTGTSWYEKAALCGDPSSSGNSTMITNEYVENILDVYGFENIETNYGNGNYDNWMESQLEDGNLYMNYRGYYGASGFGGGEINGANNGYMTPFVSFITCGTGDFNYTALSEEFLTAGSVSNPKGAVAAVGTATTGTHTLFNNIMSMGIFDGIFPKNLKTAGAAVANGRLALYATYPSDPSNKVSIFSHWLNLMGDPGLHLWTDTPMEISANFNNSISWGTNFIEVSVLDDNNQGVEDALITLLKGDDEIFTSVLTDSQGVATILLDYNTVGEVFLTVTKKDCIPIEQSFQINAPDSNINLKVDDIAVIDGSNEITNGNNDGFLNPGEIVYLSLPVTNYGSTYEDDVVGILTSDSQSVSIIYGVGQYSNIPPNGTVYSGSDYVIQVDSNAIDTEDLGLRLNLSNSNGSWESIVPIEMKAGLLVVSHVDYINNINAGQIAEISVHLSNIGSMDVNNVIIEILPSGSLIDVLQPNSNFGDIAMGYVEESSLFNPIQLLINGNAINGSILPVNARLSSDDGYDQTIVFNIQIGEVTVNDPLGPDDYGYYIYDSGDLGYSLAPIYDWIEIDNDFGGDGVNLNLSDSGDGNNINNSSAIVDLPFDFTFYGISYDKITVNTNGWIAFGESSLESFRNYPIPGAGGPSPMLAVFWDDLKTGNTGEIYKYIGDNYVIVEWSDMKTYPNNASETFQVILFDDTNLTPTGDNEILMQYKDFNNTSNGNLSGWGNTHGGYSTIGIENHLSTIGLQYTFNNDYPTAAMTLSDNSALFITTRNPVETLMGDANQDGEVNVIDVVVIVNHILVLELLPSMGIYISDYDGDGNITVLDVIQVIQYILNS